MNNKFSFLILLSFCFLSACSSFPAGPDNQNQYTVIVLENGTKQPEFGVDIDFFAYFTGTFGRAYLLETQGVTDQNGTVMFDLEYDDADAQILRDSVESITEAPVFQIGINGPYAVWRIYDQNNEEYPPVIINREVPAGTELTFEATRTALVEFTMQDTMNPSLFDEVRITSREIAPVGQDTLKGNAFYFDFQPPMLLSSIAADSDTEIRWEIFEGPDQGSLQKVGEGIDTIRAPFGGMVEYTIFH